MAVGDGIYYRMQHHQGDSDLGDVALAEDRAKSLPSEAESIVDDVRREKLVTELAVHSTSDDLPTRASDTGVASWRRHSTKRLYALRPKGCPKTENIRTSLYQRRPT